VATAEAEAIAEAEAAAAPETAPSSIDIVCGLHCCGGLSERALELAIHASAHFAVCTCCFCSNPELASLTHSYAASLTHSYADSSYARSISAADSSPTDKGTTIEGDGGAAGAGGGTKDQVHGGGGTKDQVHDVGAQRPRPMERMRRVVQEDPVG
jgi:hypothetical protein